MNHSYLNSAIKQFEYYKSLGDKTFSQLTQEQLFYHINEESNSIAIIVKHIVGNMLSRWTNFLTEDGVAIRNALVCALAPTAAVVAFTAQAQEDVVQDDIIAMELDFLDYLI